MDYILSGNPKEVANVIQENRIRVQRGVISFTPIADAVTTTDIAERVDVKEVEVTDTKEVEVTDTKEVEVTDTKEVEVTDTKEIEVTDTKTTKSKSTKSKTE